MDVVALGLAKAYVRTFGAQNFAAGVRARFGNRWVALGDSITAGIGGARYQDAAQMLTFGRLQLVANAGVAGNTAAQMLARFDTDVTPYAPNTVTILAGTNDTGVTSLASYQTTIKAIVAKCQSIGAVPVILTIPPNGNASPAGRAQQILIFNAWLRRYAQSTGVALVDIYGPLADPSTGAYLAAYDSGDHTHPSPAGMSVIGSALSNAIASLLPPYGTLLPQDTVDANNLIQNGLFLSNGGGKGNFWSTYGSGQALSIDTTDATIKGNWQRIQLASTGGPSGLQATSIASFTAPTVGHTYALCGLVKIAAGQANVQLQRNFGSTAIAPVNNVTYPISKGAFYGEWVCTAGTTSLSVLALASTSTIADFSIAQVGLYDLTQMGV